MAELKSQFDKAIKETAEAKTAFAQLKFENENLESVLE